VQVAEGELALGGAAEQLLAVLHDALVLHVGQQPAHVALAEQLADKADGVKGGKVIMVLARADKGDGRARRADCRERAAALGVAVQL